MATALKQRSLNEIESGRSVVINEILGEDAAIKQLRNMGMMKGCMVKILNKAHAVLIEIGNTRIGLSMDMTRSILVREI
ncbi:MAG: Fe2+ transport system protein FeoA [Candidatus Marinamargulisbacteria bacterium]|jgi:Fe2+ transport system protein FeoA